MLDLWHYGLTVVVPHRHAVDRPQFLSDGEDVQQGLSRMLPDTISSINHRFTAMAWGTLKKETSNKNIITNATDSN